MHITCILSDALSTQKLPDVNLPRGIGVRNAENAVEFKSASMFRSKNEDSTVYKRLEGAHSIANGSYCARGLGGLGFWNAT
jgi:hypothetical protein